METEVIQFSLECEIGIAHYSNAIQCNNFAVGRYHTVFGKRPQVIDVGIGGYRQHVRLAATFTPSHFYEDFEQDSIILDPKKAARRADECIAEHIHFFQRIIERAGLGMHLNDICLTPPN